MKLLLHEKMMKKGNEKMLCLVSCSFVPGMVLGHADIMTWKYFLHYWPYVIGIHKWIPLIKNKECRTLMFPLLLA